MGRPAPVRLPGMESAPLDVAAVAAWSCVVAGGLLLVASGLAHALRVRHLRGILAAQRLLPPRWQGTAARSLGPLEATLGALVLGSVVCPAARTAGPLAGALTYAALAAYAARLLATRPGVSCGCFGSDEPVVPSTVARALLLALGSLAALLTGTPHGPVEVGVTLAGAVLVAVVLWVVPQVEGLLRGR